MTSDYFVIDGLYKNLNNGRVYKCVGYCDTMDAVYLVEAYTPDAKKFNYVFFEGIKPFSFWWEIIFSPEPHTEGELFA